MTCPMPMNRSRVFTMEAMIMEMPVNTAAPSRTITMTPMIDQNVICNATPRMMAKMKTMSAWVNPRQPADKHFAPNQGQTRRRRHEQFLQNPRVAIHDNIETVKDGDKDDRLREDARRDELQIGEPARRDCAHLAQASPKIPSHKIG